MSSQIHPAAVIHSGAEVGNDCEIGPYCVLGEHVRLGDRCRLHSHVVLDGHTTLGDDNEIFSFACLGKNSQDLKYKGEETYVKIGSGNVFREYVTVNAATTAGTATVIGDNCHVLSYCHIAHDCTLGDNVVMSSNAMMSGHVIVGDHAIISGYCGIVQFVRVGAGAFIGGYSKLTQDALPYCIADGVPAETRTINKIGMERRGFSPETIRTVRQAFKTIIRSGLTLAEAAAELEEKFPDSPEVKQMLEFARASDIGLARRRSGN